VITIGNCPTCGLRYTHADWCYDGVAVDMFPRIMAINGLAGNCLFFVSREFWLRPEKDRPAAGIIMGLSTPTF